MSCHSSLYRLIVCTVHPTQSHKESGAYFGLRKETRIPRKTPKVQGKQVNSHTQGEG